METPGRILVVEDDSILVVTILRTLRQSGYEVAQAVSTGEDAITAVERERPDLVLMDIHLPGSMDGIMAAEHIWTTFRVPIIYLTGHAAPAIIERAKRAEPFGFLVKPFHEKELYAAIETALYKHRMEQALQEANRKLAHEMRERRQSEDALRESTDLFRTLIENQGEGIVFIDREGSFVFANPAAKQMLGIAADDIAQRRLGDFLEHPEVLWQHPDLENYEHKQTRTHEIRLIRPDGESRDVLFTVSSRFDQEREFVGIFGIFHDITTRKAVEQALQESESRFRRISELISDYAYVFRIEEDGAWTREWVTDAFTRMTGYSPEEIDSGGGWCSLVHPEDRETFLQHRQSLLTGGKVITEYRIITRHQDIFWLRDYGRPEWSEPAGRVTRVFGAAQDISEQKQAAEERRRLEAQLHQAQRLEALGTLAGGIAHDFNNILGTMLGYTDLLRETAMDGTQEQVFLERVNRAGKRAKDLVQQILAFSRTHEFHAFEPIDPAPIIEEAIHFIQATIPANIALIYRLQSDCPKISANATQIHQVIINLCLNAVHAMKAEGGSLEIVLEQAGDSADQRHIPGLTKGDYVKVTVTDTGKGMVPDVKERIFEPFFTTKAVGEGSGLGLSVVHGIMKSHHGVIAVDSAPGQGTQFKLFFPVTVSPAISDETGGQPSGEQGRASILVLDDEPALVKLYEIALTKRGYHITSLTNSIEALQVFRRQPSAFDVMVVDQNMPELTGAEFSAQVLQERPDMPIILVTGYNADVSEKHPRTIGIRQYFMKPLNVNDLIQAIRTILTEK